MDADELSAYAEGALPERARLRYAAHLADCDSCRKVVTELVIASNVASTIEAEERGTVAQTVTEPERSLGEWLASLFSPPVLRFAVPLVALLLVSAIIFIVATRRSADETSLVAKNEPSSSQPASSNSAEQKREASANDQPASSDDHGNATVNTTREVEAKPGAASQQSQPNETGATTPPAPPQPQQDGAVASNAPKAAAAPATEQPPVAQERKEAEPPKPTLANEPADTVLDRGKEKDETLAVQKERNEEAAGGAAPAAGTAAPVNGRRSRSTETAKNGVTGAASETASDDRQRTQSAKSLPASRAKRDAAGPDEDSNSTAARVVAGKRFRQQNGIWVDTTYSSSRSLTTVRRGTEQYRALVADEPIIATAANELGNCIIVVKGRAYHVY